MTVVRELVGELGFRADTTAATRFDAAMKRSKANLESLNQISLVRFTGIVGKAWGIVGAVATAGSLAAAKRFADVETSLGALELATKKSFGAVKKEIESILRDKTLKNLVNEIDLVNSSLAAAQEGATGEQITRFLKLATSLGIVAKKPIGEVLRQLVTGDVEAIFKLIGQLPLELQELLKLSKTQFENIGLAGRRGIIEQKLFAAMPELEKTINEQRRRGLLTFKELGGAFDKLTMEIGERTLPAFKGLNDIIVPFIEKLTKLARGEIGFVDIFKGTPEQQQKIREFKQEQIEATKKDFPLIKFITDFDKTSEEVKARLFKPSATRHFPIPRIMPRPEPTPEQAGFVTNNRSGDLNINVPITIQPGANADAGSIEQAVNTGIRRALGAASEQAKQATMIRGGN